MEYKWSDRNDRNVIAQMMIEASGGLCEYLLNGFSKHIALYKILAFEMLKIDSPLSLTNSLLLCQQSKTLGLLSCYPVESFMSQMNGSENLDRMKSLRPYYEISVNRDTLYIDTLCITEEYRGYGLGRVMLRGLKYFFERHPYEYVGLYVWANNEIAYEFYLKLGFIPEFTKRIQVKDFPIQHDRVFMMIPTIDLLKNLEV